MNRKHPRDSVLGVHLMMEISKEILTDGDLLFAKNISRFSDSMGVWFPIYGSTKDFLNDIGWLAEQGCSQTLIDHLKYAREKGARWVLFETPED